jgi:hypothetical protein
MRAAALIPLILALNLSSNARGADWTQHVGNVGPLAKPVHSVHIRCIHDCDLPYVAARQLKAPPQASPIPYAEVDFSKIIRPDVVLHQRQEVTIKQHEWDTPQMQHLATLWGQSIVLLSAILLVGSLLWTRKSHG